MYPSSSAQSADPISQITDAAGRVALQDGEKVAKTDAMAADIDAEIEEMMRENGIMEEKFIDGGTQPALRTEGPSSNLRHITVLIRRQL